MREVRLGEPERRDTFQAVTIPDVDRQPTRAERPTERRQDEQQRRRTVGGRELVDETVKPSQLTAGRRVELLPGHERDDVVGVNELGAEIVDHRAIAEDDDAIREPEHLVDVVGDEDDRDPLRPQPGDDGLDLTGLGDAERRRRLVEDDESGLVPHRASDGEELTLSTGEGVHRLGGVPERDVELLKQGRGATVEARVREQAEPTLVAEEKVRRDVEVLAEREVLPDDGNPEIGDGIRRGHDRDSVDRDRAVRRGHVTDETPHERGLSRSVLTGERHNFADPDVEVDVVEGLEPTEPDRRPRSEHARGREGSAPSATRSTAVIVTWPS